ncbi:microtubule-associated protein 2 isoform X1 [Amblyraja radiata]|uniref:microtubule-associated protein 2 isoform X1 n=1 Tax=Amblyraja radiata TaxID=386614 RepID=UPI001402CE47|nr:microtubule-associated protein 2 isoform X1 [Amblyraja radiata]XP_032879491.1 microtubule-associated protein 2 isoform X1 [Amblyraja radiata]XP_032879493.1 microtubule-associated protein 2 isoform X1 [Amblyraja radiata]XP_032879494.1 microtubule-associated protein 2 isoform X1 [Amblyraja radiata]
MADDRKAEANAPQWASNTVLEAASHQFAADFKEQSATAECISRTENGYSFREHPAETQNGSQTAYTVTKANGINGKLAAGDTVTAASERSNESKSVPAAEAEVISARIVQEVTAEAVAVLKGEQGKDTALRDLPKQPSAAEDITNLPPSPPPSPASEHCLVEEKATKMDKPSTGGESSVAGVGGPALHEVSMTETKDKTVECTDQQISDLLPSSTLGKDNAALRGTPEEVSKIQNSFPTPVLQTQPLAPSVTRTGTLFIHGECSVQFSSHENECISVVAAENIVTHIQPSAVHKIDTIIKPPYASSERTSNKSALDKSKMPPLSRDIKETSETSIADIAEAGCVKERDISATVTCGKDIEAASQEVPLFVGITVTESKDESQKKDFVSNTVSVTEEKEQQIPQEKSKVHEELHLEQILANVDSANKETTLISEAKGQEISDTIKLVEHIGDVFSMPEDRSEHVEYNLVKSAENVKDSKGRTVDEEKVPSATELLPTEFSQQKPEEPTANLPSKELDKTDQKVEVWQLTNVSSAPSYVEDENQNIPCNIQCATGDAADQLSNDPTLEVIKFDPSAMGQSTVKIQETSSKIEEKSTHQIIPKEQDSEPLVPPSTESNVTSEKIVVDSITPIVQSQKIDATNVNLKERKEVDQPELSKYFETFVPKDNGAKMSEHPGDGYYEMTITEESSSRLPHEVLQTSEVPCEKPKAGEKKVEKDSLAEIIHYSTLVLSSLPVDKETESTTGHEIDVPACPVDGERAISQQPDSSGDANTSEGLQKLVLNLPTTFLDSISLEVEAESQGPPESLSPLASDILACSRGISLDESAEFFPIPTPAEEKQICFPIEVDKSQSVSTYEGKSVDENLGLEPQYAYSHTLKQDYKNDSVVVPDLPEMLDLGRRRLSFEATETKVVRRASMPAESTSGSEALSESIKLIIKNVGQPEEMGYCVFEYSGPLPTPEEVKSPLEDGSIFLHKIRMASQTIDEESVRRQIDANRHKEDSHFRIVTLSEGQSEILNEESISIDVPKQFIKTESGTVHLPDVPEIKEFDQNKTIDALEFAIDSSLSKPLDYLPTVSPLKPGTVDQKLSEKDVTLQEVQLKKALIEETKPNRVTVTVLEMESARFGKSFSVQEPAQIKKAFEDKPRPILPRQDTVLDVDIEMESDPIFYEKFASIQDKVQVLQDEHIPCLPCETAVPDSVQDKVSEDDAILQQIPQAQELVESKPISQIKPTLAEVSEKTDTVDHKIPEEPSPIQKITSPEKIIFSATETNLPSEVNVLDMGVKIEEIDQISEKIVPAPESTQTNKIREDVIVPDLPIVVTACKDDSEAVELDDKIVKMPAPAQDLIQAERTENLETLPSLSGDIIEHATPPLKITVGETTTTSSEVIVSEVSKADHPDDRISAAVQEPAVVEKTSNEECANLLIEVTVPEIVLHVDPADDEVSENVDLAEGAEEGGIVESVVTVEDDVITVVQTTLEGGEDLGHSVRFAVAECDDTDDVFTCSEPTPLTEEQILEPPAKAAEIVIIPEKIQIPTDLKEDESIDESVMDTDSCWMDTQDEESIIVTQHAAVTKQEKPQKEYSSPSLDKHRKGKLLKTAKNRASTPERKIIKKDVSVLSKEDKKKRKVYKKSELAKKTEIQTRSPSRKIILKPAVRYHRPAHVPCTKRKQTAPGSAEGAYIIDQKFSVAKQPKEQIINSSTLTKIPTSKLSSHLPERPKSTCSADRKAFIDLNYFPTRSSSAGPRDSLREQPLSKDATGRSPEKRSALPRPASILTVRRTPPEEKDAHFVPVTSPVYSVPRRPTTIRTEPRNDQRGHGMTRSRAHAGSESARSRSARSGTVTPSTPGSTAVTPGTPPSYSRTPGSRTPRTPGTPGTHKSPILVPTERKVAIIRTPPKSPLTPKQLRVINQPMPDLKNIKSKIGSIDNLKLQPRGAQVPIANVKPDFSHIQPKCGSLDNMRYSPLVGNVQIVTKKIDVSHITSKCGSFSNIHYRPGGGHIKIESQKLDFKEKAQPKVGSFDNTRHTPGGGNIKIESHKLCFRENARARVDHGADIVTQSPGRSGATTPHKLSNVSSSGSINLMESPQLATLADDVTAALAKQGL